MDDRLPQPRVVLPAVVPALQDVAVDLPEGELRRAVGAVVVEQVGVPLGIALQDQLFAQPLDTDRLGAEILGAINGVPEVAKPVQQPGVNTYLTALEHVLRLREDVRDSSSLLKDPVTLSEAKGPYPEPGTDSSG